MLKMVENEFTLQYTLWLLIFIDCRNDASTIVFIQTGYQCGTSEIGT